MTDSEAFLESRSVLTGSRQFPTSQVLQVLSPVSGSVPPKFTANVSTPRPRRFTYVMMGSESRFFDSKAFVDFVSVVKE